ncbi:MAG: hypothetical protein KC619_02995 [Myxococcales bacterium]|nr:hypothetical protein [Myxococcales bacterium]
MRLVVTAALLAGCSASIVPSDGAVPDGVSIVGTWHDCNASVTYRPDGTAHGVEHRAGCEREGTWTVDDDELVESWDAGTCAGPVGPLVRRITRTERGLIVLDPATGQTRHLADDATPHGLWRLEGTELGSMRSTTASIVGDPESTFGSGCYWSTDGECGGLFSCSGTVLVWQTEGTRFSASTACSGGCPCGAVIEGTVGGDGALAGDYRGVNCERSIEGMVTARPLP